jgi:hypothetical protein
MEEAPVQRKAKFKKQTLSQNQTDVVNDLQKRYFDDDNNFIDYFIEVGVKPEIFKNKVLYECDDPEEINQYLIPQIITKFPNFDKKTVVIENSMIHQIFPQGFKLYESDVRPEPNFYCLVLDNQLYSAIYTRKYLACLIIYESIEDYKILYDKYKKEDDKFLSVVKNIMDNEINDNAKKKYSNFYIPKCLSLVSVHPYIDKYEEILRTIYELVISGYCSNIFIDQIIEKLIIETPKIPRGLKRILLKFPNNEIELTETKMNQFPSVNVNLAYTFDILSYNNIIEIYKYLLYETKLVFFSEDLYSLTNIILSFLFLLTPFNYQFQIVSILSKELYNFIETISPYIFGINEKYTDNFFSKHKISVEDTTICIIDIDKDNFFLIAPGGILNQKEFPDIPKKLRKKLEDKIKTYLINRKKKRSISQYFSNQNNTTLIEENVNRCSTYKNCSFMSVLTCVSDFSTESVANKINYKNKSNDNEEIQKIFSKFMINLLKDYPKFLTKDYSVNRDISQSIKDMIDLKSYLNLYSNGEKCFYSKIFSTQMFMEFIYKRMMPKDCNEKVEVLFIEEKIQEKLNEKNLLSKIGKSKNAVQYILLHCKEYDYDEDIIIIDLTGEKGLTYGLKCYLLNNKLLLSTFLNRGYNINIDEDSFDISFTYNIFPSLLSDKLFILNIEEYQKRSTPFYKDIEAINAKIVNKIALKFIQEKNRINNSESKNDLYLCYLIVWSMVFWYTEEDEKDDRFIEMLGVLEKVDEHDVKIFEMLFKTLVKYSKDENVILLYKKFIHLRLNPSWDMFSLVSKIIKKKQNIDRKNKLLHQDTNMEKIKLLLYNSKKANEALCFPNRTYKTSNKDDIIFSNKILFYSYFLCKNCKKITNLGEICSELKEMKMEKDSKGIERLKCNFKNKEGKICSSLFEQPFRFKLGEELFNQKVTNNQIHRYFTSVPRSVILLSPTEIKKNLLQLTTNKKKEEKFDVENFKSNYPDIFWSLLWYFNLHNIDKNFMLPYQSPLKNVKFNHCENDADSNNIQYIYNRFAINKDDENNEINGKKVFRLNAKESQIKISKKKNEIKTYKTEDLCIQNIYEFCIIENLGFFSNRSLYIYNNNIAFNEMPLLSYDKDNNSVFSGSIYFNDSESSTRISLVRDSVMSCQQVPKRSTLNMPITGPSKLSKSGPGLSDIGYKLGGRDSLMTKCIVFEESDDSLDN